MQIDWFTFLAQIINFLILIALLRRFLYGPITRAMTAREARIADQFRTAETLQAAAKDEADRYEAQRQELVDHRTQLMAEAADEVAQSRAASLEAARSEIDSLMERWYTGILQEQETFFLSVRERIGELLLALSRRALRDLANAELEAQAVTIFCDRLLALPVTEQRTLVKSAGRFEEDLIFRSAYELAYPQRQQLVETVQELIVGARPTEGYGPNISAREEIGVRFEQAPELLCGVELQVREWRVAWALRDYLENLEDEFEVVLVEARELVT